VQSAHSQSIVAAVCIGEGEKEEDIVHRLAHRVGGVIVCVILVSLVPYTCKPVGFHKGRRLIDSGGIEPLTRISACSGG
jgi:hypothetical protein